MACFEPDAAKKRIAPGGIWQEVQIVVLTGILLTHPLFAAAGTTNLRRAREPW